MGQYANDSKWNSIYISLNTQAKNKEPIIFSRLPEITSDEEIEKIIQELNSLSNFKDYTIFKNDKNIKGVRYV